MPTGQVSRARNQRPGCAYILQSGRIVLGLLGLLYYSALGISAQAQIPQDWDEQVERAKQRAVEYLIGKPGDLQNTGQMSTKMRLIMGDGSFQDIDAEWKDLVVAKGTNSVRIKGRVFDEVDAVLPPGWFHHEPFAWRDAMGQLPKRDPKNPGAHDTGGVSALATLAVLSAGVDPFKEPKARMALESCCYTLTAKFPPGKNAKTGGKLELTPGLRGVYAVGLHACALEMGLQYYEQRKRADGLASDIRRVLNIIGTKQLQEGYRKDAGYDYLLYDAKTPGRWDLSVTQYGILGLWACARANVELDDKCWRHLNQFLLDIQSRDGGWAYATEGENTNPSLTMTSAGIASLFVIMDIIHTRNRGARGPDISPFTNDPLLLRTVQAIDRGLDYWGRTYHTDVGQGYLMYGAERVGVASGYKYFGNVDWYREGAVALLARQRADGSWDAGGWGADSRILCGTAWNLLFLVYGGAPILINKLQHGPKSDIQAWHNYPRDAANVARWYSRQYEQMVGWQILDLNPQRENDLLDAPILYISGHKPLAFTDPEIDILRRYVENGGTLLFVANAGRQEFIKSVIETGKRLYNPEVYPEYGFTAVPKEHGLYNDPKLGKNLQRIPLWHMSNGHRSFAFLVPMDINHHWQTNRWAAPGTAMNFELISALRNYATERATTLPSKIRPDPLGKLPKAAGRSPITVGVVKYTSVGSVSLQKTPGVGTPERVAVKSDWASAPIAWRNYGHWFTHVTGHPLQEERGVLLTDPQLSRFDLLHLTGHYNFQLSKDEFDGLAKYIQDGGTVLFDCTGGVSMEFAQCARRLLGDMFPQGKYDRLAANNPLILGKPDGFADVSDIGFSRQLKLIDGTARGPSTRLDGLLLNGRTVAVVARCDLSVALGGHVNWERIGFDTKGTRELVANLLMQAKSNRSNLPVASAAASGN